MCFVFVLLCFVLYVGDSDLSQLVLIFSLLGIPTVEMYPELSECVLIRTEKVDLNDYIAFKTNQISVLFPKLSISGVGLLKNMLNYSPKTRVNVSTNLLNL